MNFVESHERLFLKFSKGRLPLLLLGTPAFSKLAQKCHCAFCTKFFAPQKQENSKKENSRSFKQIREFSEKKKKYESVFCFEKTLKNVFIPKIRIFAEYAQTHTLQNSDVFHQSFLIVSF